MITPSTQTFNNETLTISLSNIPQIPWSTVDTHTFSVETFYSAVMGSLVNTNESKIKSVSDKGVLLEKYLCKNETCYAKLKQGIKFHNGREVNAYDVEFSLLRQLLTCDNSSFAYSMLSEIKGVKSFCSDKKEIKQQNTELGISYPTGIISGINVIDKYNISINLNAPNYFIFQTLSTGFLPIVPIEELSENYLHWKKYPVGFGRYRIINADVNNYEFNLEKVDQNENIIKYIRLVYGDQKNVDIRKIYHNENFDQNSEKSVVFGGVYANGGFLFNFKTPLGANSNFRKAIHLALNREKICTTSHFNEISPEDQIIPNYGRHKNYRYEQTLSQQNVSEARRLLQLVPEKYWKDRELHVHSFWSDVENNPYFKEIVSQLKNIGLNVIFHNTQKNYTRFRENDENVLWWTGFDIQTDQPNMNFSYFQPGSFFNNIYPDDQELSRLYNATVKNLHQDSDDIKKLNQYFYEQNIMVVVFNVHNSFVYNKKRIRDFGNQSSSVRLNIAEIILN